MKAIIRNLLAAMLFIATSLQTHAQGMLIYDQQSTNPPSIVGDYLNIQDDSPLLQSFIPTLSAIGFAQFEFWDFSGTPNNGTNGATIYVNIWTGSPNPSSATLLGSTTPIYMPEGFGESSPGVTNFYFLTPIALTPGQIYYLQPVVQSGDNPWTIWAPGNTYPNGQLFERGIGFSGDLWFREGVVASVPEPSTLVLIGLAGFLIFTFKRRSKLVVPLLFAASLLSVHAAGDSVVKVTADAAGLAPAATLPRSGTFWVMTPGSAGQLIGLPYPALPANLSGLPAYSADNNIFIVDNTGGQLLPTSAKRMNNVQATAIAQMQAETMAALLGQILSPGTNDGGSDFQYNDYHFSIDTNGLWIEAFRTNGISTNLWLRLHNTVSGENYQLLSTSNLLNTNWDLGQILVYANDDYTDFSPVSTTHAASFYRAHHANPVLEIVSTQDSEELDPTNASDPGHAGIIYIQNNGRVTNDVTVYYQISGTAQNGVDYSNLTGVATISLNQGYVEIDINPTADGLKPDQTVILTLLQNTNYLIDPAYYSATNNLTANPQVYPVANGDFERGICPNIGRPIDLSLYAGDPRGLPLTYTILTHPAHGNLTGTPPYVTYTPTNCYEGQDSFTFTASDGQFTSAPATVNLVIANSLYANLVTAQTCRGESVPFTLYGGDNCGTASFWVATPLYGTVTNLSGQDYVYRPNSTNFTGTDNFNYIVYNGCGDAVTNTVAITVGDANLLPDLQSVMTGTNQAVTVTLGVTDSDRCADDADYYTYAISSSPTNGTLTGTPPNLIYRPNANYEGPDAFQFTVRDGNWVSAPATVNLYVVAGPMLAADCNPFGTAVRLDWGLDDTVERMVQQNGLNLYDFIVYRSAVAGGPYTAIATNAAGEMSYEDTNAVIGQTNFYVVNFESLDSGITYESPLSNEVKTSARNPNDLIAADAVWQVTDITDANNPTNLGSLKAPFSSYGTNQYPNLYPLPNHYWPVGATWTNHIALYIPTNTVLTQVQYSIAIDNEYQLYVNGSASYVDTGDNQGTFAVWSSFKTFESVAPGLLHYGTNDLGVVIQDWGDINYFSMVVTTNACGQ